MNNKDTRLLEEAYGGMIKSKIPGARRMHPPVANTPSEIGAIKKTLKLKPTARIKLQIRKELKFSGISQDRAEAIMGMIEDLEMEAEHEGSYRASAYE